MNTTIPAAVYAFDGALADWLASFIVPEALGEEMARAVEAGGAWVAAVAGTSVKRSGWSDSEALAWGICMGACAGSMEATRASLGEGGERGDVAADGPARRLLAADGLIAAAHEALSSLSSERLVEAMEALGTTFADGGPWRVLSDEGPRPAWPIVVPTAILPAAKRLPDGPWGDHAEAWKRLLEQLEGEEAVTDVDGLWDHPAADSETRDLMRATAEQAFDGLREDGNAVV